MQFSIKSGNPEKQRNACIVIPVFSGRKLSRPAATLDKATKGAIKQHLKREDMEGNVGDLLWLYDLDDCFADRILLVGCGTERELTAARFKTISHGVARALNKSGAADAATFLTGIDNKSLDLNTLIRLSVLSIEEALYVFDQYKTARKKPKRPLRKLTLTVSSRRYLDKAEQAMLEGMGMAAGVKLARDLGNMPPNICNPTYLARQAKQLQKTYPKLNVEILDETEMKRLGMGAFLSVSQGSAQPGKLICMHYNGIGKGAGKPIVLVGKGITFDTGGISIKPSQAMDEMKYDMGGAASVFGTLQACMDMQLAVNLVGIVAAAENMPGSNASRPGDIVTTLSGQTVEILNTDAEGRLVLCDALTYAKKYDPEVVIDIATLTGACIMALGHHATGMLTNTSSLGRKLENAGEAINDRLWELPLWDEYGEQLKSNFADMANIGGRPAGTITAASYLSNFTKNYRWAHLDIAGTAWHSGKNKGATGRPVPLLTEFILQSIK